MNTALAFLAMFGAPLALHLATIVQARRAFA